MPPLEEMDLHDTAVVWAKTGINRYNEPVLAAPIEIPCRWIERRSQVIDRDANPIAIEATLIVADTVEEGWLIWKGELADWTPALKNKVLEVVVAENTPSLNGRDQRNQLKLRKFRQKLPEAM